MLTHINLCCPLTSDDPFFPGLSMESQCTPYSGGYFCPMPGMVTPVDLCCPLTPDDTFFQVSPWNPNVPHIRVVTTAPCQAWWPLLTSAALWPLMTHFFQVSPWNPNVPHVRVVTTARCRAWWPLLTSVKRDTSVYNMPTYQRRIKVSLYKMAAFCNVSKGIFWRKDCDIVTLISLIYIYIYISIASKTS